MAKAPLLLLGHMTFFSGFFSGKASLGTLLKRHFVLFLVVFALLQLWRPCFFLADDNLAGFLPYLTELGRRLKTGQSPFYSDYLFGGHYYLLRDISCLSWHPFYLLPSLMADTRVHFWMMDAVAAMMLLFGLAGFTLLAWRLREKWNPALPDIYLTFYTFSFFFSTFSLTTGASWINFLGSEATLPWLMLAVMEPRFYWSVLGICLVTVNELLTSFLPLIISIGACMTFVAVALAFHRRSPRPVLAWVAGNLMALMVLLPVLSQALDGFAHAPRGGGVPLEWASRYNIPAVVFPFSYLAGNWTNIFLDHFSNWKLEGLEFPYPSTLMACAAAWCIFPALINSSPWRFPEKLCAVLCAILVLFIIRPAWISLVMHQLPFLKSMRWPFRETMLLLFFLHLFFVVRPPPPHYRWLLPAAMGLGLAVFIAPMPFIEPVTFNKLALDREAIFSGKAQRFWDRVKTKLVPGDMIITVIPQPLWEAQFAEIPYTYSGTANFPCMFRVVCASGYSVSAPDDQAPLKAFPYYWFGAFRDQQLPEILAQRPHLVVIRVVSSAPLKILMVKDKVITDLTPLLRED
jgi:hypothetical protein